MTMQFLQDDKTLASPSSSMPVPASGLPLADPRELLNRIDWNLQCADISANHRFSLLMVGVDNLWAYADCLGTHAADRLLKGVAESILRALLLDMTHDPALPAESPRGARAMVALMPGDMLAVLLEGTHSTDSGAQAARRIRQALYGLSPASDLDAFATATMGVVDVTSGHQVYPGAQDVLRDAQAAMHHARARGRGWACVFQPDIRRSAAQQLKLECELRRALNQNEFHLAYQPIVSLETGALKAFEALLRWNRPDGAWVSPAEYIPLAEETGLVWPIGEFVLNEACKQLAAWRRNHAITMNVNVSRRQFCEGGLPDLVAATLKRHGLPGESLVLEITEGALQSDISTVMSVMNQLTAAGVALHLDDFGTGYSSLGSLHQFPVKGLKIDRSFITSASGRRDYAAVLQAIVVLAENLGLEVVGEGVETKEQLALLQSLNCPCGQGYLFGRPMSADAATELLTTGSSLPG